MKQMLFNDVMALSLEPNQIADLNERTEGWIVGLQLACMSPRGRPSCQGFIEQFTGSHQFILDYLTEEVLSITDDNLGLVLSDKRPKYLILLGLMTR